jgi:hypothetical protein
MKKNIFSKSMENKTDMELRNVVEDNTTFTKVAIQAALWEMEFRNNKESGKLKNEFYDILEENQDILQCEPIEYPADTVDYSDSGEHVVEDLSAPELYAKNMIFYISIFFTPIIGSILFSSNLKEMNKSNAIPTIFLFASIFTFILVITILLFWRFYQIPILINIIGSRVLTEHLWNKYIGSDFKYRNKIIRFI